MLYISHPSNCIGVNAFSDTGFTLKVKSLFHSKGISTKIDSKFSYYKSKVVFWDEDYDVRVLSLLDSFEILYPSIFNSIVYIQESEGRLFILFSVPISSDSRTFLENEISVAGDIWHVEYSFIYN